MNILFVAPSMKCGHKNKVLFYFILFVIHDHDMTWIMRKSLTNAPGEL